MTSDELNGGALMRAASTGDCLPQATDSRNIALMSEPRALAPAQLEERRLIHRDASSRLQSDTFREIRTRLLGMAGPGNFVTLVAAVSPRSGASFVARNLAAAFALDETKTSLLVDCNLRYPAQHQALAVEPAHGGLAQYLEDPARGVAPMIYATGVPRMRLIPVGGTRENSGESLSGATMHQLVQQLQQRYHDRYLVLDGPAVHGSPDARILADLADLVVLVAGYGHDTPAAITQAATQFAPEKFAGVIFNQVP